MSAVLLHPASAAAAAIVIRAALALWWGTLATPQVFETEHLIRNWFAGRGYVYRFLGTDYRSFHSMLPYDLLYAGVHGLSGGHPGANLVVQWLFAALLCVVVWHLGMRLGGPVVAGLAAWLAAIHPGLVAYDATRLIQFSFDATLVAAALLAFVRWAERPSFGRAGCAGLVTGLLMYERGTMGLFFPVALLWVKGMARLSWSRWIQQAAFYGAIAGLLLFPWMVRNVLVHERFVPFMSTSWIALWQGNNEAATGTEFTADGRPIKGVHSPELRQRLDGKGELEQMQAFRDAALTFIRTQPVRAAELYVRKLGFFWWRSPHTGILYPAEWMVAYQAWYLVFIGCAILGFVALARGDPGPWAVARLIFWLAVCFSAGQAVFYIGGRHRWTIEPVLGLLSAAGFWWLCRRRWRMGTTERHPISPRTEGTGINPTNRIIGRAVGLLLIVGWPFMSYAQVPPSSAEKSSYTGLWAAAMRGDATRVRALTAKGEEPDARDAHGRTPLHVAAYGGHHEAMRELVAAGANPNALENDRYDIVTIAAVANDVPTLEVALAVGTSAKNVTSRYDGTALIAAAHLGHAEVVRTLIRAGAPLDHVNNLGWTALIESIVLGDGGPAHTETLRALVEAGANVNLTDRNGHTPLSLAQSRGYGEMVKLLERAGPR